MNQKTTQMITLEYDKLDKRWSFMVDRSVHSIQHAVEHLKVLRTMFCHLKLMKSLENAHENTQKHSKTLRNTQNRSEIHEKDQKSGLLAQRRGAFTKFK